MKQWSTAPASLWIEASLHTKGMVLPTSCFHSKKDRQSMKGCTQPMGTSGQMPSVAYLNLPLFLHITGT
jgi:hypothetical protein